MVPLAPYDGTFTKMPASIRSAFLPAISKGISSMITRIALPFVLGCFLLLAGCQESTKAPPPAPAKKQTPSPEEKAATKPADPSRPKARHPLQQAPRPEPRAARAGDWFEDKTASSGVDFTYSDGSQAGFYEILEVTGGGVALFDYDADGDLDIFLTGGGDLSGPPIQVHGRPCALYRNDGDWKFTDVTQQAQLGDDRLYTHGCTVGDFDRDGWPDLFVAGFHGARLYRNLHSGRFEDATEKSSITVDNWAVTGAWADVDNDGWLDLYVVTYCDCVPDHRRTCLNDLKMHDVCGPTSFPGQRDALWRNRGDGTFEDVTEKAGLTERDRGLGVVANDFNEDGWIDFYVVNDVNENRLYCGVGDLKFEERGLLAGVSYSSTGEREGSMGVDIGDFNGDGLVDIFYTNFTFQDNSLLQKTSPEGFLNVNAVTGIAGMSRKWVKWGTGFVDFDNDGWQDLFICSGHVRYETSEGYWQPAYLAKNEAGQKFVDVSDQGGPYFSALHSARGAAAGDLDNDGAPDLVISHHHEPVAVLRNQLPAGKWVKVQLQGKTCNTNAIGAKVSSSYSGRTLTRWVRGGGGYLSHFDPRIQFPLDGDSATVKVHWPGGKEETFADLAAGQTHVLVEGGSQK